MWDFAWSVSVTVFLQNGDTNLHDDKNYILAIALIFQDKVSVKSWVVYGIEMFLPMIPEAPSKR